MTNGVPDPADIAAGFVAATEERDLAKLRALLHERATFWTNVSDADTDRESRLGRIALEFRLFESFCFDDPRIDSFGNGFLIRTRARGALTDGQHFAFPICIVGELRDGKIGRLEEYFDPSAVTPILGAMAASDTP